MPHEGSCQRTARLLRAAQLERRRRERLWDWRRLARESQLPPSGDWRVWLVLAGRGFGKTRCGAEWVRELAEGRRARRIALIGPTAADVRRTMIEGQSGLLSVCPPWNRPIYLVSQGKLVWPNGAEATAFSADRPDRLRGPQHDALWADELAVWRHHESWDMAMLGLRLGADPRAVVTTTPKPIRLLRGLVDSPNTAVTRGTTYENRANLAPAFFDQIITRYRGTRLGRQELEAELLDEAEGALWRRQLIEESRLAPGTAPPEMRRVVVGLDPAAGAQTNGAETGIVVASLGHDGRGYVLADLSGIMSPDQAARRTVDAWRLWQADRVIGEVNNGGDWIEAVLRAHAPGLPYRAIRASRGKQARAEPVAALYEQGRVRHADIFAKLEDQLCGWAPGAGLPSPDRLDALVWSLTELMLGRGGNRLIPLRGY
jgi:phage terminase large subunit-like protein